MRQTILIPLLLVLVLVLTACGATPAAVDVSADSAAPQEAQLAPASASDKAAPALTETLLDEQGAVTVSVRPLNGNQRAATLDFEVAMNTHSVDLSMDLATLATLTTDTGQRIGASAWQAPQGWHHVTGVLSFPATNGDNDLLAGASRLTLTLRDVDAAERTFVWNLK
jgi:hypothetical protein